MKRPKIATDADSTPWSNGDTLVPGLETTPERKRTKGRPTKEIPRVRHASEYLSTSTPSKYATRQGIAFEKCVADGETSWRQGSFHSLSFASTNLSGKLLRYLPSGLKVLDLSYTKVAGLGFGHLPQTLEWLSLAGANVSNYCLKQVAKLPSLLYLNLAFNEQLKTFGLAYLAAIESLETLILDGNHRLTDNSLTSLPKSLKEISLRATSITIVGLSYLPATLRFLNLSNMEKLQKNYRAYINPFMVPLETNDNNEAIWVVPSYAEEHSLQQPLDASSSLQLEDEVVTFGGPFTIEGLVDYWPTQEVLDETVDVSETSWLTELLDLPAPLVSLPMEAPVEEYDFSCALAEAAEEDDFDFNALLPDPEYTS